MIAGLRAPLISLGILAVFLVAWHLAVSGSGPTGPAGPAGQPVFSAVGPPDAGRAHSRLHDYIEAAASWTGSGFESYAYYLAHSLTRPFIPANQSVSGSEG